MGKIRANSLVRLRVWSQAQRETGDGLGSDSCSQTNTLSDNLSLCWDKLYVCVLADTCVVPSSCLFVMGVMGIGVVEQMRTL